MPKSDRLLGLLLLSKYNNELQFDWVDLMQFSNNEILKVVRQALDQSIAPELRSQDSQAACATVVMGIDELLKRSLITEPLLTQMMPKGISLAEELLVLLSPIDETLTSSLRGELEEIKLLVPENPHTANLHVLERQFNGLLDLMKTGSVRIVELRRQGSEKHSDLSLWLHNAASWERSFYDQQRPKLEEIVYDEGLQSGGLKADFLQDFLLSQAEVSPNIQVNNLERIPGGMSKETYFFDLMSGTEVTPLVVRKSDPKPALDIGIFDLRQEFDLVSALFEAGFTVPEPKWLGYQVDGVEGTFYVVDRAQGKVAGSVFGAEGTLPEKVLLDLARKMATLHKLPLSSFEDYVTKYESSDLMQYTVSQAVEYYLKWWYDYWRTFEVVPSPAELYLFDWLFENIPNNSNKPSMIHGDFSLHNFLYEGDSVTAVLDWEGSHLGDPAEDLAYVRRQIVQHMEWSKFVDHYLACGGREIDESTFAYYDCLANTRNLVATNKVASRIKHRDTNDTKDLYLALEFIPEFMQVAMDNANLFRSG